MKRKIIKINEEKCNGCGNCIPACPEGAMQVIDGKARLISDLFCDGLGACMGHCPEGAMEVEEREAEAYDEIKVMQNIVKQGNNVIKAHLLHLKDHGDTEHYNEACEYLKENGIVLKEEGKGMSEHKHFGGCPGARTMSFDKSKVEADSDEGGKRSSQLRQWPIQLHLVSPQAPYFQKSDVLLAADCVAFS
ncbi:MAG: 4Fe-4S ferredoxin iron-sulfur binding protein, partial [uncultured bacterium]